MLLLKFSHAMEKLFSAIIHACIHVPNGPIEGPVYQQRLQQASLYTLKLMATSHQNAGIVNQKYTINCNSNKRTEIFFA